MQPLSDKLTSHCVTSYPSALVTSKTDSYATSRSLTSCRCVVSKSRTRYLTNQRATAWQAMGWLRHKQNSHSMTNYAATIWQTNFSLCGKLSVRIGDKQNILLCNESLSYKLQVRCQPRTRWLRHKPNSHFVTNYAATIWQTNYSVCDKPTNTNRFWLGNVLRATAAWFFSSIIWPDGSAPVALASHKSLEKHRAAWLSYLFSHLHLLSSDSFASLIFFLLLSSSLCLCPSLHFSSVYIVGSLTSKLPSKADCMTR